MAAGTSIKKAYSKLTHNGYKDLGAIINYTNDTGVVQDTLIPSGWYDSAEWVKNCIILISADQIYDLFLYRRDSSGVEDWSNTLLTNSSATSTSYASISLVPSSTGSINGVMGYSFKFVMKNKAVANMKRAILRLQVIG